jgi:hypothetical protein
MTFLRIERNPISADNGIYQIYTEVEMGHLLLKFRPKVDTSGVTRNALREMAQKLGVSETQAVHFALARMYFWLSSLDADNDAPDAVTPGITPDKMADIRKSLLKLLTQTGDEHESIIHPPVGGSVVVPLSNH